MTASPPALKYHLDCELCGERLRARRVLVIETDYSDVRRIKRETLLGMHRKCWERVAQAIQRDRARRTASDYDRDSIGEVVRRGHERRAGRAMDS